jgi:hypothetical protein
MAGLVWFAGRLGPGAPAIARIFVTEAQDQ